LGEAERLNDHNANGTNEEQNYQFDFFVDELS
jgi:hypothetical protein